MQQPNIIEYWTEKATAEAHQQGLEQGIEQGARQTSIESTIAILNQRFPNSEVTEVRAILEAIRDIDRLKHLNLQASIATSLTDFQEHLDR